jgi:HPt (histidine-containing phosphotransfer) domain-containing protein
MKGLPTNNQPSTFDAKDDFHAILDELREKEGDYLVDEFIKIFSNRIPTDITHLIESRKNSNFRELKQKAHFLSTTLVTLKFTHGRLLASEIENAVDSEDTTRALKLTDQFIEYLNKALNTIS